MNMSEWQVPAYGNISPQKIVSGIVGQTGDSIGMDCNMQLNLQLMSHEGFFEYVTTKEVCLVNFIFFSNAGLFREWEYTVIS